MPCKELPFRSWAATARTPSQLPMSRPAKPRLDDGGRLRSLHQGVVDGLGGAGEEGFRIEPYEAEIGLGCRDRLADRLGDTGLVLGQFAEQQIGRKHEVSRVPQIPFVDIARRCYGVGLFDESRDGADAVRAEHLARPNVTITGAWRSRLDAERHDAAGGGGIACRHAGGVKQVLVENDMVGGERQKRSPPDRAAGRVLRRPRWRARNPDAPAPERWWHRHQGLAPAGGRRSGTRRAVTTMGGANRSDRATRIKAS